MTRIRIRAGMVGVVLILAGIMSHGTAIAQDEGIPAGSAMPAVDVTLVGQSGATTLATARGDGASLIVFWSNRCPWSSKIEERLVAYVQRHRDHNVSVILVNSNDPGAFAKENAAENKAVAARLGVPVLGDTSGDVARAFGASRNPAFFLFDENNTLSYSGSFDDSPGDAAAVKSAFLEDATSALVAGSGSVVASTKAFGCRITPVRG